MWVYFMSILINKLVFIYLLLSLPHPTSRTGHWIDQIKTVLDEGKLKEFIPSMSVLKEVLQAERK